MKIGIVSENFQHDSQALKALLRKKYQDKNVEFLPILKKVSGDKIFGKRVAALIEQQAKEKKLDLVLLAKDLDALPSDESKIIILKEKANNIRNQITLDLSFFLIIFELEALILADIDTFKKIYKIPTYQYKKNPKFQSNPKEELKKATRKSNRKYKESDTPEIFQQLNFNKVYQNHNGEYSFQSFINELESTIK